jgi:hypothetical protein
MKAQILKIAGVKTEAEFYKKFPSEEAFMKKHGKQLKKAQNGGRSPIAGISNKDISGIGNMIKTTENTNSQLASLADLVGPIVGNVQDYNQTNKDIQKTNAYANIADVVKLSSSMQNNPQPRKIDYNSMRSQTVSPLGVGTNYLQAEDGAEIQNIYSSPLDIYSGLGYEPLNDSNVKQFQSGGGLNLDPFSGIAGTLGGNLGSATGKGTGRGGAASSIGSSLGDIAGNALLPGVGGAIGSLVGGFAGGLIDSGQQNEMQMAQDKLTSGVNKATMQSGAQAFQSQNSSFMKHGGWVSHDWQPQTITKFGDYSMDQLLAPPHDADMLRAGGHLAQVGYTAPSQRAMYTGKAEYGTQMAMGGDLQVHRGQAETLSYNPFLPDGGETIMFRGPSHDNGGMPISYGQNGVEVEGGEPAVKLQDGGSPDGNLVVYGNMIIPKYGVAELGDKNAEGKKFKHYVDDLSKIEAKQNKIINQTTELINNTDDNDQFDKLSLNTGQANLIGTTMKLKEIAEKKKTAAVVQNAILDTASEMGVESDALAKGKIKYAKPNDPYAEFGAKLSKAQTGKSVDPNDAWISKILDYEYEHGSPTGTGLKDWGYHTRNPKTKEEAIKYFKEDYLPKVANLPKELQGRAADWMFNTGKDPRIPLLLAAGKIKSNAFGPSAGRIELAQNPDLLNEEWNKYADEIANKAKDPEFLKKFDTARKVMYQNINKGPNGEINPAYGKTWKGRTEIFNDDVKQAVTVPASTPKGATPAADGNAVKKFIKQIPFAERKAMATANYIENYTGTAAQNQKLFNSTQQSAKNPIMPSGTGVLANAPVAPFDMFKGINPVSNRLTSSGIVDDSGYVPSNEQINMQQIIDPSAYAPINMSNQKVPIPSSTQKGKGFLKNMFEGFNANSAMDTAGNALSSLVPFIRPTTQQALDPSQLLPEMMALSQNQLEPVQAQLYNPMLQAQPYRMSLQDQRNEVIAQQRAAERMAYGNPAAAAMIAAGASDALNKINAEEFRANQSETMRAGEANRALMNDAQMKNLAIMDQQYARQSEAKSKTKTQAVEVAKSVAQKIAENKKENRQQSVMENMYPAFSFTKSGVAYKNPAYLANLNAYGSGKSNMMGNMNNMVPDYEADESGKPQVVGYKIKKEKTTKRNGAIVKAIKGL